MNSKRIGFWKYARSDAYFSESRKSVLVSEMEGREVFHYSIPVVQEIGTGRIEPGDSIDSSKVLITQPVLLVSKLNPRKGTVVIASPTDYLTVCSGEFVPLVPERCFLKYLYYVFVSEPIRQMLAGSVQSVTRSHQRVNPAMIRKIWWHWPEINEQRQITAYLDRETARIDRLIEEKTRLIELLAEKRAAVITHAVTKGLDRNAKMKPSGVEWIGDIPSHWMVSPLYSRFWLELGKMLDTKQLTGKHSVPYIRNIDVQWDRINTDDLPEMDIEEYEYHRFILRKGDLLVCEGGEVGRCAIWENGIPFCAYQKAIHRIRSRSDNDITRFLFYLLRNAASSGIFIAAGNPNTIPHLTGEQLRVYRFPFPPKIEQQKIVEYLDHATHKIDILTEQVNKAIDSLREYRSALITAAVTGQICVA